MQESSVPTGLFLQTRSATRVTNSCSIVDVFNAVILVASRWGTKQIISAPTVFMPRRPRINLRASLIVINLDYAISSRIYKEQEARYDRK